MPGAIQNRERLEDGGARTAPVKPISKPVAPEVAQHVAPKKEEKKPEAKKPEEKKKKPKPVNPVVQRTINFFEKSLLGGKDSKGKEFDSIVTKLLKRLQALKGNQEGGVVLVMVVEMLWNEGVEFLKLIKDTLVGFYDDAQKFRKDWNQAVAKAEKAENEAAVKTETGKLKAITENKAKVHALRIPEYNRPVTPIEVADTSRIAPSALAPTTPGERVATPNSAVDEASRVRPSRSSATPETTLGAVHAQPHQLQDARVAG